MGIVSLRCGVCQKDRPRDFTMMFDKYFIQCPHCGNEAYGDSIAECTRNFVGSKNYD